MSAGSWPNRAGTQHGRCVGRLLCMHFVATSPTHPWISRTLWVHFCVLLAMQLLAPWEVHRFKAGDEKSSSPLSEIQIWFRWQEWRFIKGKISPTQKRQRYVWSSTFNKDNPRVRSNMVLSPLMGGAREIQVLGLSQLRDFWVRKFMTLWDDACSKLDLCCFKASDKHLF